MKCCSILEPAPILTYTAWTEFSVVVIPFAWFGERKVSLTAKVENANVIFRILNYLHWVHPIIQWHDIGYLWPSLKEQVSEMGANLLHWYVSFDIHHGVHPIRHFCILHAISFQVFINTIVTFHVSVLFSSWKGLSSQSLIVAEKLNQKKIQISDDIIFSILPVSSYMDLWISPPFLLNCESIFFSWKWFYTYDGTVVQARSRSLPTWAGRNEELGFCTTSARPIA